MTFNHSIQLQNDELVTLADNSSLIAQTSVGVVWGWDSGGVGWPQSEGGAITGRKG